MCKKNLQARVYSAISPLTGMQSYVEFSKKNTLNHRQQLSQFQANCYDIAKVTCQLQTSYPASCRWSYPLPARFITCYRVYFVRVNRLVEAIKFSCFTGNLNETHTNCVWELSKHFGRLKNFLVFAGILTLSKKIREQITIPVKLSKTFKVTKRETQLKDSCKFQSIFICS